MNTRKNFTIIAIGQMKQVEKYIKQVRKADKRKLLELTLKV